MSKRDYYEVLGVDRDADDKVIKSAYRKLAMQYHPDRNPDDTVAEEKFREATEAYDVLKDDQKRAAYDRMGHAAFDQNGGFGGGAGFGGAGFGGGGGFSDIFDEMFSDFMGGSRRQQGRSNKGSDLRYNMSISLEEAFSGGSKTITIPVATACEPCEGSGAKPGTSLRPVGRVVAGARSVPSRDSSPLSAPVRHVRAWGRPSARPAVHAVVRTRSEKPDAQCQYSRRC